MLPSGWRSEYDKCDFVETDWAGFGFTHPDWNALYWINLESQPRFGQIVLGVWHNPEKGITRNDQVALELARLGWGKEPGGPHWDGHSPLPDPFLDWTTPFGNCCGRKTTRGVEEVADRRICETLQTFRKAIGKLSENGYSKRIAFHASRLYRKPARRSSCHL
jgi:hypothetical protein